MWKFEIEKGELQDGTPSFFYHAGLEKYPYTGYAGPAATFDEASRKLEDIVARHGIRASEIKWQGEFAPGQQMELF